MSKIIKLASLLLVVIPSMHAHAQMSLTNGMQQQLVAVCQSAKNDRVSQLHRDIKKSHLNYVEMVKGLKCNGSGLIEFAAQYNASNTVQFLIDKTSRVDITDLAFNRYEVNF